jgi:hypothetical protein
MILGSKKACSSKWFGNRLKRAIQVLKLAAGLGMNSLGDAVLNNMFVAEAS